MSETQFQAFLSVAVWLCAIASALNLLNLKRRGNAAFLLSGAFLLLGIALWLHKLEPKNMVGPGLAAGAVLILILADAIVKARSHSGGKR